MSQDIVDARKRAKSHFQRRALDRHGIIFRPWEYDDLIKELHARKGEFLCWAPDIEFYRCFYRLEIQGLKYVVMYDFNIDALITIYHNSWLKLINGKWENIYKPTRKQLKAQQESKRYKERMELMGLKK